MEYWLSKKRADRLGRLIEPFRLAVPGQPRVFLLKGNG